MKEPTALAKMKGTLMTYSSTKINGQSVLGVTYGGGMQMLLEIYPKLYCCRQCQAGVSDKADLTQLLNKASLC